MRKVVPGAIFVGLFHAAFLLAAQLNTPAPTFALVNTHHEKRALSDYRGKIVFINFWASWCGPCQEELPELNRLAADYKGKRVQVLAINVDEDRSAAKKMIARLGLASSRMEILLDSKSKVVSAYNIDSMPSSFILDAKGVIRFTHVGFHEADPAAWRRKLGSL